MDILQRTLVFADRTRPGAIPEHLILQGKEVMDPIRATLDQLGASEQRSLAARREALARSERLTFIVSIVVVPLALLGTVAVVLLFTAGLIRAVKRIEENAKRLERGESLLDPPRGSDELARLGQALSRAAARLAEQDAQLRESRPRGSAHRLAQPAWLPRDRRARAARGDASRERRGPAVHRRGRAEASERPLRSRGGRSDALRNRRRAERGAPLLRPPREDRRRRVLRAVVAGHRDGRAGEPSIGSTGRSPTGTGSPTGATTSGSRSASRSSTRRTPSRSSRSSRRRTARCTSRSAPSASWPTTAHRWRPRRG